MPKLVLDRKVKYKGKSYPVNAKGVTEAISVDKKDVKAFESITVEAFDDDNKKLYMDKRDKTIESLESELDKLRTQLAKKDEIITDLEVQVEELKGNQIDIDTGEKEDSEAGTDNDNSEDKAPGKPLEEKTVEELYAIAGELDISGRSKLRNDKDELLKAVKKALAEKAGE